MPQLHVFNSLKEVENFLQENPFMNSIICLDWAIRTQKLDFAHKLLTANKEYLIKSLNGYFCNHNPPFIKIIEKITGQTQKNFLTIFLRSKVFDINQQDLYGRTALYYAIYNNQEENTKRLIKEGASIFKGKMNLLTTAIVHMHKIVPYLLEQGADVNLIDETQSNALNQAILHNPALIPHLVIHGACLTKKLPNPRNPFVPLDFVMKNKKPHAIDVLHGEYKKLSLEDLKETLNHIQRPDSKQFLEKLIILKEEKFLKESNLQTKNYKTRKI